MARAAELGLVAVTIEGGLIAPEQVQKIAGAERTAKLAASYECPKGTSLGDEIARYFRIGQALWNDYSLAEAPTVTRTAQFAHDLLAQCFGFDDFAGPTEHQDGNRRYRIAWEARQGRVPVVVAAPIAGKDAFNVALPQFGDGAGGARLKRSPVSLLQDWLNANPSFYWGLVFAGDRVRLMRDNDSLTRPAWIEADLGAMFRDEMFADFAIWWLLVHGTRFGAAGAAASDCRLEEWRNEGLKQGTVAREKLRDGVEAALLELGRGAVEANPALREKLRDHSALTLFFEELLRTVYRLIFLAVAEDRDLLHSRRTPQEARALYAGSYSFTFWRARSRRRVARDAHHDAWEAIKVTLGALERGEDLLGLPALGGLFTTSATPLMNEALIPNRRLLEAVFNLGFLKKDRAIHRINWRDLKTEELGSVYESLLEIRPQLAANDEFILDSGAKGSDRKISGSYYTPDSLVETLLDSALDPVLDNAEAQGETTEAKVAAILELNIIDPACGSGHFLLGAARRMADRVAKLRNEDAGKEETQKALRDVVGRTIYGVDRNPMAVELAKVALWIESVSPGQPLGFLDANIRCGDALLGVFDLDTLEAGIPDEAYKPILGDDNDAARYYLLLNRDAKRGQGSFDWTRGAGAMPPKRLAANLNTIRRMPEDTVGQVEKKKTAYEEWRSDPERWSTRVACDLFVAAFLLPKTKMPLNGQRGMVPTTADVRKRLAGGQIYGPLEGAAVGVAAASRLLHWPLTFPDVMVERGGFDVVLGNPPWDTMSPDAKEFFSRYEPEVRFLGPAEQKKRIAQLLEDPVVASSWDANQDELYRSANFMRNSGRYSLFAEGNLGKGDFNIFRMFTELAFRGVRPNGIAAQIVPENFYNGANAAALRGHVFAHMRLNALLTFENTRQVWFEIHSSQKFCLYSAWRGGDTGTVPAAFGINSEAKLAALDVRALPFQVPLSLVRELSPVAMTIAEFADPRDISIARKLHARLPSFGAHIPGANSRIYMREIDMGNDRETFMEAADGISLFEGRMVEAFDYRAKAYVTGRGRQSVWDELPFGDAKKRIAPQWRIDAAEIPQKLNGDWQEYRIGFCDVASPSNSRAMVATMIPAGSVCGHKVPTIKFRPRDDALSFLWLGIANSFCLDFLARQKVALTMSYTIVDSLPLPRTFSGDPVEQAIARHSAQLACAGSEMAALWDQAAPALGLVTPPAEDIQVRRGLRAELDVYVARDFFGLSRDEMRYLLDPSSILGESCGVETFGALKRAEMRDDGEFTSYGMIMEAWDRLDAPR